jgi:hypothetical protein
VNRSPGRHWSGRFLRTPAVPVAALKDRSSKFAMFCLQLDQCPPRGGPSPFPRHAGKEMAGDGAQLSCLMLPFEGVPTRHLGHAGSLIVCLSESTPSAKGDADDRLCPRQLPTRGRAGRRWPKSGSTGSPGKTGSPCRSCHRRYGKAARGRTFADRSGASDLRYNQPTEATTMISTRLAGWASFASTVPRAGVAPGATHASHTSFISAKRPLSASHTLADRIFDLSEPASANNRRFLQGSAGSAPGRKAAGRRRPGPRDRSSLDGRRPGSCAGPCESV